MKRLLFHAAAIANSSYPPRIPHQFFPVSYIRPLSVAGNHGVILNCFTVTLDEAGELQQLRFGSHHVMSDFPQLVRGANNVQDTDVLVVVIWFPGRLPITCKLS